MSKKNNKINKNKEMNKIKETKNEIKNEPENIIEVNALSKRFTVKEKDKGIIGSLKSIFKPRYKSINAVNQISLNVKEGEILAFLGPNGAGKSTTIKMLTGILFPSSGVMSVTGFDPSTQRKKLSYNIGTVFGQKQQLWSHLTPYDNFKFFGQIYDLSDEFIENRIKEFETVFDISKFINTPVRSLSLGQRMQCEIIASLIHRPKILFLDEPTIGLDPVVKENIRTLIKKMNKEYGTTIFLTSHDIGDIEKLCKRIIIINNGKVVLDDTMNNIKSRYLKNKLLTIYTKAKEEIKISNKNNGIIIRRCTNHKLEIDVDMSLHTIGDIIKMVNPDNINDINISDIPLEDIISEIYKKK